mmetsp:Transcript_33981/g.54445  ORF Transcript_33981/g.54445 Transcript_33981/m.54445 type:complete len:271 (-) Transcript_33981:128-940(-)
MLFSRNVCCNKNMKRHSARTGRKERKQTENINTANEHLIINNIIRIMKESERKRQKSKYSPNEKKRTHNKSNMHSLSVIGIPFVFFATKTKTAQHIYQHTQSTQHSQAQSTKFLGCFTFLFVFGNGLSFDGRVALFFFILAPVFTFLSELRFRFANDGEITLDDSTFPALPFFFFPFLTTGGNALFFFGTTFVADPLDAVPLSFLFDSGLGGAFVGFFGFFVLALDAAADLGAMGASLDGLRGSFCDLIFEFVADSRDCFLLCFLLATLT